MLPKFKKNAFSDKVSTDSKSFDAKKVAASVLIAGTVATASTQIPNISGVKMESMMKQQTASITLSPKAKHTLIAMHYSHSSHSSHSSHYSSSY
jgi:uncharacterized protein YhbP (UPF0306 family)